MKKEKIILLITLWFILLNFSIVSAQVKVKNEANELYKKVSSIMVRDIHSEIKDGKLDVAMDYALEILKKYPESLESYYILEESFNFNIRFSDYPKAYEKLKKWYNLILESSDSLSIIDDPNVYTAEKIIVTRFFYIVLYGPCDDKNDFFRKKHEKSLILTLENMRKHCKNKSYRALATIMLFSQNKNYKKIFIKNFPHHAVVPILKLELAVEFADNNKYKKAIKEIEKLINTYKDVVLPDGWKFEIECYSKLLWIYSCIDDYKKSKKYYMLIIEKAPNHPEIGFHKNYIETMNRIINEKEKEQK